MCVVVGDFFVVLVEDLVVVFVAFGVCGVCGDG